MPPVPSARWSARRSHTGDHGTLHASGQIMHRSSSRNGAAVSFWCSCAGLSVIPHDNLEPDCLLCHSYSGSGLTSLHSAPPSCEGGFSKAACLDMVAAVKGVRQRARRAGVRDQFTLEHSRRKKHALLKHEAVSSFAYQQTVEPITRYQPAPPRPDCYAPSARTTCPTQSSMNCSHHTWRLCNSWNLTKSCSSHKGRCTHRATRLVPGRYSCCLVCLSRKV